MYSSLEYKLKGILLPIWDPGLSTFSTVLPELIFILLKLVLFSYTEFLEIEGSILFINPFKLIKMPFQVNKYIWNQPIEKVRMCRRLRASVSPLCRPTGNEVGLRNPFTYFSSFHNFGYCNTHFFFWIHLAPNVLLFSFYAHKKSKQ